MLVGGQALWFWAERYALVRPERQALLASKDVDFVGSMDAARQAAVRLGVPLHVADLDHATANFAFLRFSDAQGIPRIADFLGDLCGVRGSEVERMAVPSELFDAEGRSFVLKVMHPVVCLESRLSNCVELPKYRGAHGLEQARMAIQCVPAYLKDLLDGRGQAAVRPVGKLNERVYRFRGGRTGRTAANVYGLEAFEAVLLDERLPEAFRTMRYPQMAAWVAQDRARGQSRDAPDLER